MLNPFLRRIETKGDFIESGNKEKKMLTVFPNDVMGRLVAAALTFLFLLKSYSNLGNFKNCSIFPKDPFGFVFMSLLSSKMNWSKSNH